MRLANVLVAGVPRLVMETDDAIVDVSEAFAATSVEEVLRRGDALDRPGVGAAGRPVDVTTMAFRPIGDDRSRYFCVAFNFAAHANESGRAPESFPTLFLRTPQSVVGHGVPVERPVVSEQLDWEGEVAVVIGASGRRVPASEAMALVAGYTIFAENSVRDWQLHTRQVTPGKNFDASGAVGPWFVSRDEVPDHRALQIVTRVNGDQMQCGTLENLIYDVPELLAYISAFSRLLPGDVVAMGTPPGVGGKQVPPRFLAPGDVVEVEVPGLGLLRNEVILERASHDA